MKEKKNIFSAIIEKLMPVVDEAKTQNLTVEQIAKMLNTSPEAYKAFEEEYQKASKEWVSDNAFEVNAKQASKESRTDSDLPEEMINRIVAELLAQAPVWRYKNGEVRVGGYALPDNSVPVTNEEIMVLPKESRPQCTGNLAKVDINGSTAEAVLTAYDMYRKAKAENAPNANSLWGHFMQGLDILDLDWLTWNIINQNVNSMGYWLPRVAKAIEGTGLTIPDTTIVKVPLTLLQMTRIGWEVLTPTTKEIANRFCDKVFSLEDDGDYFIKTGTYSSKYDFRNARVKSVEEVHDIGEYLLYIHSSANMMAGALTQPHPIVGVSTTTEWVCRKFIPAKENTPEIYCGLPLRPEFRVFIDGDTKEVLSIANYWDPEVMEKRFAENRNGHDVHDAITFTMMKDKLVSEFDARKWDVIGCVMKLLDNLDLEGQWSVDIMYNETDDTYYLIDMALAQKSAYYETVPESKRRPIEEKWIPDLSKPCLPFSE